jgi:membrane protein insertase Oxa1/YidC/SpoIIIJ
MLKGGTNLMKSKLLFWTAILFLVLGINARDSALFYFFSIHLFMLFIGVILHKLTLKLQPDKTVEPLSEASE